MADSEGAGAEVVIPVETDGGAVELVIDKPAEAVTASGHKEPVIAQVAPEPQKVVTADEGIESLKDQIARAKAESQQRLSEKDRRIQEAFENARRAELEAVEAKKEVLTVKQSAVLTALDSLKRDKDDAKRKYKLAMEAGEFDKAADAQDEISLANARIVETEKGKLELEERAKAPPAVTQRRAEPLANDDPAERFAASIEGNSPRSAQWVREHPEFARDQDKTKSMERAHYSALAEGFAPESTPYFDHINQKLGITKAPIVAQAAVDPPRETARAPASAPVSRDIAQSPSAQRPGSIHLTAEEVRTAIDTYSPLYPKATRQELLQKYATDKVALMKEGKIGRVAS
jgi:hypothetical protein